MGLMRTPEMALMEGLQMTSIDRQQELHVALRKVLLLTLLWIYYKSGEHQLEEQSSAQVKEFDEKLSSPARAWLRYWLLGDVRMMAMRPWLLPNIKSAIKVGIESANFWNEPNEDGERTWQLIKGYSHIEEPEQVAVEIYQMLIALIEHPDVSKRLREWNQATDEEIKWVLDEFRNNPAELEEIFKI